MLSRLIRAGGLDTAVQTALLARVWTILGGCGTIFFVAHYLSAQLQGYYYTFNSLIALQLFVELGLNVALVQFVSHEMAKLAWRDGRVAGDARSKQRMSSLLRFDLLWFGAAACLLTAVLIPLGHSFFSGVGPAIPGIFMPWDLLVAMTGLSLVVNGLLAVLEGCNLVSQVILIRLAQAVCGGITSWVLLSMGAGLLGLAVGAGVNAAVGLAAIFLRYRTFFLDLWRSGVSGPGVHWSREIWPFQWRIAVSWASGYLIFQVMNPLIFAAKGPAAAGRLGMSLQILSALNATAMVWINTKVPTFGQLIARGERRDLDTLFRHSVLQSLLLLIGAILAVLAAVWFLQRHHFEMGGRLLEAPLFGLMCLIGLSNHLVFAQASYLRAHKQDPFMPVSVANGLVTLGSASLLVPNYGLAGALASYALGSIGIGLLGGSFVFLRKRSEWSRPLEFKA
jgi:O-antigen/teichoic acid export membrane protein